LNVGVVTGTTPTLDVKLQGSPIAVRGGSYVVTGTNDNKLRAGATTTVKLAAKFTQSGARQVKKVVLDLKVVGTITAGKLVTVDIFSDTAGSPNASLGASNTVLCSAIGTAFDSWVEFTFAKPVNLSDATVYHVVLSGDYTASGSNYVGWASGTVASLGNQNTFDNTNWTVVATESHRFWIEQYNFADISGYTFAQVVSSSPGIKRLAVSPQAIGMVIRPVCTITGSSPHFNMSLELVAHSRVNPVAAQA
jgi:hypothetical protein